MSVAVVTGAGSGLGRVIARTLLGAGWQVALAGRREELLAETAQTETAQTETAQTETAQTETAQAEAAQAEAAQAEAGGSALVVPTDVTSATSVAALFDAARDRWGRLDLL